MIKRILPPFIYLAVFFSLVPSCARHFSSRFFADTFDGLQNVWNLWWVNHAVSRLCQSPWFTDYLHFPDGISLVGQTLNPFNGFIGIALQRFLSLAQTYNTILVFSFVMGGMTAFWLCRELTGSYAGSIIGGAVFTFSNFHFMHAEGHLQLVSLEWLPLFVLWWIRFCKTPDLRKGAMAAFALFLVMLCDYYYFLFCVLTGILFFLWSARTRKDVFFMFRGENLRGFFGFLVPALLTSGALVLFFLFQNAHDPFFSGSHPSRSLSADLLSPFIWGPHWLFREWVEPLWRPLVQMGGADEYSVHLGLSVIALSVYAWKKRAALDIPHFTFWVLLAAFFFVMSLGPNLHIWGREVDAGFRFHCMGKEVNPLLLPYALLWLAFPPLRLSGIPIRMMVMVQLVAAIMAAGGFRALLKMRSRWKYGICAVFLAVLTFEYLPTPITLTKPSHPAYVEALKNLPDGAVLDLASLPAWALYYQTVHGKKMGFGFMARYPESVERSNRALSELIRGGKWEQVIRDYRFSYIVKGERLPDYWICRDLKARAPLPDIIAGEKVFNRDGVSIYRF
ncbi:MAG: hypothetical protein JW699_05560 [Chitinispirillaceae bacterium]|nr:hypothetical protein [Chitinispirillaceae bacterium]